MRITNFNSTVKRPPKIDFTKLDRLTDLQEAVLINDIDTIRSLYSQGIQLEEMLLLPISRSTTLEVLQLLLYRAVEDSPALAEWLLFQLLPPSLDKIHLKKQPTTIKDDIQMSIENNIQYYTALLCKAAHSGSTNIVILLLAIYPQLITTKNAEGRTVMHRLAICLQEIKKELKSVTDAVQEQNIQWLVDNKKSAIIAMKYFVHQGGDIDQQDNEGNTPRSLLEEIGLPDQPVRRSLSMCR